MHNFDKNLFSPEVLVFPKIIPVRGVAGFSFLVIENPLHAVLVDCGFGITPARIEKILSGECMSPAALKAVVLTHAHLDHCVNVDAFCRHFQIPVICPAGDVDYLAGKARYRGLNKVGGFLERAGRFVFRYRAPTNIVFLAAGETCVPLAPSFVRVELPGHTPGHSGYFIPATKTLLAGDLFAGAGFWAHRPPRIFTANRTEAFRNIFKAAEFLPEKVFVAHVFGADGVTGAEALRRLAIF